MNIEGAKIGLEEREGLGALVLHCSDSRIWTCVINYRSPLLLDEAILALWLRA